MCDDLRHWGSRLNAVGGFGGDLFLFGFLDSRVSCAIGYGSAYASAGRPLPTQGIVPARISRIILDPRCAAFAGECGFPPSSMLACILGVLGCCGNCGELRAMVAVKNHQSEAFMKVPDGKFSALLFYGTDAGLVMERARLAAKAWANLEDPAGEIIRIDESDLDNEPDRLAVELDTLPMFGGRKVVRVTVGRRLNSAMLKPIVERGSLQATVIVEAGNLKPTDGMRKAFEKAAHSAAVACFADDSRDLASVVRDVFGEAGLSASRDVIEALVARLGADRALSRAEIEKLALYCRGRAAVEFEDVEAVVGDAAELTVDRVIVAAAAGNGALAVREFNRYCASGESAQAVVISAQRYFDRLFRVRCDLDSGRPVSDALRSLRPPVHFKQRDAFSVQCRDWSSDRLLRAIGGISACVRATRRTGAMEKILVERLLLSLAQMGARGGRRPA